MIRVANVEGGMVAFFNIVPVVFVIFSVTNERGDTFHLLFRARPSDATFFATNITYTLVLTFRYFFRLAWSFSLLVWYFLSHLPGKLKGFRLHFCLR